MARVGIDLDGVIYDFNESLRSYLISHKGWSAERCPDATRWEFYLDWGMTAEEFLAVCHAAANTGWLFRYGEPINDARRQIARLRDAGHSVHFITDRGFGFLGEPSQRNTLAWLEEWRIRYDSIDFTADKATVAGELGIDYMIDDKPENYVALERAGVDVSLQDRPWNRDVLPGAWVVGTLEGFVNYVITEEERKISTIEHPAEEPSGEVRTTSSTGGQKGVKPARFDLLPAGPLWQVAELYGKGAEKYAARNWELGYEWSKSFGAMMRHAWQFWGGEDIDTETGMPHMASVVFHAFALLQFMEQHPEFDDRPTPNLPTTVADLYDLIAR